MNPKPISSMQRATSSGPSSMFTPSVSSTSAEPHLLVLERLPCLATAQPAAAATSAAAVEMLNVDGPPPVPAVSTRSARSDSTCAARRRIVRASPTSSATVSPFVRRAIRKAAVPPSPARPSMISSSTAEAWSAVRWVPSHTASIARVRMSLGIGLREEVPQQLLAVRGEHRLGMELDALGRERSVSDSHHDVVGPGRLLELVGQVRIRDQRVIPTGLERAREPLVYPSAVVLDLGVLAVDRDPTDRAPSERLDQRLMAEADTEHRDPGLRERAGRLDRDPGVAWRARPRRDHEAVDPTIEQIFHGRLVVAHDLQVRAEL